MIFWGVPAATVAPADLEPASAIAAPASTTTPSEMYPDARRLEEESLLGLSSTTAGAIELTIEPSSTSSVASGDVRYEQLLDDGVEEDPVPIRVRPKATVRMKARVVRVTRPKYEAAGLPPADDVLDDE